MSMQPGSPGANAKFATLSLEYPMSLGVFDKYADAQKAVDTLSDKGFPVQNCLIVGTDLKQLERVTGRLTWGRILLGGALSGLWLGLFVGLIFSLFSQQANALSLLLSTAIFGAIFGIIWSAIGYAFTRGARDFASVSQVVATRYEVFAEHKVAQDGRDILREAGLGTGYQAPTGPAVQAPAPGEPGSPVTPQTSSPSGSQVSSQPSASTSTMPPTPPNA